ncbi:unnamed protein product [Paramecium sonneborni]|uniref:Uncharacterized protein n=1 Tax=Paramecium sonneborni TaxID=65129 RepID=A0A8S1LIR1_9CILI|nr:unnamed protein product [Paramecium sonneborni]
MNIQQLQVLTNNISDFAADCLPNLTFLRFGNNPLTFKSLVPLFQAFKKQNIVKIIQQCLRRKRD